MILSGFTWRLKKSFQLIIVRWRVDHNSYCFSFLHLWWLMAYCSNEASREDHRGSDGRRCVLGRLVFQHHDYMLKDMVKKERGMSPNFTGFIVSAYSNFGVDQTYYQSGL